MTDTKRFERTAEMANIVWQLETDFIYWRQVDRNEEGSDIRARVNYAVAKVLSLFEPVELEALGTEEIRKAIADGEDVDYYAGIVTDGDIAISQATVQKNQSKGQLFRVKEELVNEA